jgi:hypothetical protein
MQATPSTWSDEYNDIEQRTRQAGSAVVINNDDGEHEFTWSVPGWEIAVYTANMLNLFFALCHPHELQRHVNNMATVTLYFAEAKRARG